MARTTQVEPTAARGIGLAVAMLTTVYVLSFIDRQILSILAEPIRKELHLNDSQIGLMTGLAFALLYTLGGIPLARYADRPRTNRITLISTCVVLWSIATALCGAAANFVQLLLLRVGVGIGEAGCTPAAHSLISDAVPHERRGRAMAIYGLGQPIGSLLGLVIGGLIAGRAGWRVAFAAVGLPGIALGLLVWLAVREPRRAAASGAIGRADPPRASFGEALTSIQRSRAYLLMLAAGAVITFVSYGGIVWNAIFFQRSFGLSVRTTGLALGLVTGGAGIVGTLLGGTLADRWGARQARHQLTPTVIALAAALPAQLLAYAASDWRIAMALLVVPNLAIGMSYGPSWGLSQTLVPRHARATASALKLLAQSLLGIGFGPLIFGAASDLLKPMAGADSVRWVLEGASLLLILPVLGYWLASRLLERELRRPAD